MIPLRPFQEEAIVACRAACADGKRRIALCLPTGAGKTITALTLVSSSLRKGNRALFIAHREELINQTAGTWERIAPDLAPAGIVKAEKDDNQAQFVIASAQTLWGIDRSVEKKRRDLEKKIEELGGVSDEDCQKEDIYKKALNDLAPAGYPRLDALQPESFSFIVVDEMHHAASEGFQIILKRFRPDALVLGLTATPYRGDGLSLAPFFSDGIVYSLPIKKAIREGWLCDFRYRNVHLDVDLDSIRTRGGEYIAADLENALESAGVVEATVQGMLEHARDRKSLVFTFTIEQAEKTALELTQRGIPAASISCDTPSDERKRILADFKKGLLHAVCSCGVLTEGFDEPSADCCVIARPTKSKTLYTQMVGRVLRIHPEKPDCLVLDFCGSGSRNPPASPTDLVGVLPRNGESTEEAEKREIKETEEKGLPSDTVAKSMLAAAEQASAARKAFEAAWVVLRHPPKGVVEARVVSGSKGRKVIIWTEDPVEKNGQRLWQVAVWMAAQEGGRVFRLEKKGVAIDFAQNIGRQAMLDMNQNILMQSNAVWRLRGASAGQVQLAKKLSIPIEPTWNGGEVSNAINSVMCSRDLAKLFSGKQKELFFDTPESFKEALKRERQAVEGELVEWRGKREEVST
jgi:superfamily II DNA or RNA helicase